MIEIADPSVDEQVLQSLSDDEKVELIRKHPDLAPIFTNWNVGGSLDLDGCTGLTSLPKELKVGGYLNLSYCTGLTSLPEGLKVGGSLYLRGCTSLTSLPEGLKVSMDLYLNGCTGLTSLPEGLEVDYLSLEGCTGLPYKKESDLPKGIKGKVYIKGEVYWI